MKEHSTETIGRRIQALRRQANLSQEALAGRLGVSRQALGKWEADQSLPGIDNLQALAAELGVTVDQLLTGGPETGEDPALDQPGTRPENAPPADPALSLAGVKALLDAAEQAAARRRRRTLLAVVAGILAAALALGWGMEVYARRLEELQSRISGLDTQVSGIQDGIQHQISSIRAGIEESLRQQDRLVERVDYQYGDYNPADSSLGLTVRLLMRQYQPGTTGMLVLSCPGEQTVSLPMEGDESGSFSFSGPVTLWDSLSAAVAFTLPDGTVHNETLWEESSWAGMYRLTVQLETEEFTFTLSGGKVKMDSCVGLYIEASSWDTNLYPVQASVELYIGGKKQRVWPVDLDLFTEKDSTAPAVPESAADQRAGLYGGVTYYIYPEGQWDCPDGSQLELRAVVTDNLGQEYLVKENWQL